VNLPSPKLGFAQILTASRCLREDERKPWFAHPCEHVAGTRGEAELHGRSLVPIRLPHLKQQKYQRNSDSQSANKTAQRGKV